MGGTPSQVWVWGVPHPNSGWWEGTWGTPPQPGLYGGGTQGTPRPGLDGYSPPPPLIREQYSEHLLRGGRCASYVHAGGLSCCDLLFISPGTDFTCQSEENTTISSLFFYKNVLYRTFVLNADEYICYESDNYQTA